ncbi:aldo/keto reductase [Rhizobium grahamii]|uniref:Aldo/keto reductase n=1 Tax=Rhizobium grahamii TaxID=1120045 RepID=A0A5Q0C9M3_9HYPH|nr:MULTISPECIES: aldo/keto reductase [Rhizobium]QFY62025.1 aldo/keto reductase [Rhizobium grahamii]QRM48798.1 aldo/keto reductase [Rhizobium sp. BG6]
MSKLALGTVQFGMKYGVANAGERVSTAELDAIIATAREHGIDTLDTAIAYGDAEANLGAANTGDFRIVTKLPPFPADVADVRSWITANIRASLGRLRRPSVDAVLLHRSHEIIGRHAEAYRAGLADLKTAGLCAAVGVSIYAPAELQAIWSDGAGWKPELIQAPYNVLDRRLDTSGWLDRLADAGVRVHTRSAFLQGLLLMPADKRPAYFTPFAALLDRWRDWCIAQDTQPLAEALCFVCGDARIEKAVIGADTAVQLRQIVAGLSGNHADVPADLWSEELALIDPSQWKIA